MKVQEAIAACRETPGSFARPVSWRGTIMAVDLAAQIRQDPARISRVVARGGTIAYFSDWVVSPDQLLDDWEIVTLEALSKEQEKA